MKFRTKYTLAILFTVVAFSTAIAIEGRSLNVRTPGHLATAEEDVHSAVAPAAQEKTTVSYEEIMQTISDILSQGMPLSEERWQISQEQAVKWDQYRKELVGKQLTWTGWIAAVTPDKDMIEELSTTTQYEGEFRIQVFMSDPNYTEVTSLTVGVLLHSLTYSQVQDLPQWYDPLGAVVPQQIKFSGTITNLTSDPRNVLIFVKATDLATTD